MRRLAMLLLSISVFILALRVSTLETSIKDLEKEIINRTNSNSHRMQEYERYIEFLQREYEPYIQEEKMKELNERL